MFRYICIVYRVGIKGIQVYKYTGIQVYRYTDIQIYMYTGIQVHRYTGIQVYRHMQQVLLLPSPVWGH